MVSMMDPLGSRPDGAEEAPVSAAQFDRRRFLSSAATATMVGGLVASYGTLAVMAGRFLYPASPTREGWMFLAHADRLKTGDSFLYRAPSGQTVAVARVGSDGSADDFLALSSVCPHLGCQVHWEGQNDRFFCPCHNGTFDRAGKATGGPPAAAGQSLLRFRLKIEKGLLYILVPLEALASAGAAASGTQGSSSRVHDEVG
jgi:nitrite reductase/ring-hydroxylating ferredoxin subunit